MRAPILPLLLVLSLNVQGQHLVNPFGSNSSGPLGTFGITGSSLNYPGSIGSGFNMEVWFNFLRTKDASLSFGTNVKVGLENRYGLGLPVTVVYVAASLNDGNWALGSDFTGYVELPLLLHYNFGLGATKETEKRFGFYVGGGMTYVVTGYLDSKQDAESISFYGLEADAGIRLGQCGQIGVSWVYSLRQPLGPITQNPCMFGLTLSGIIKTRH